MAYLVLARKWRPRTFDELVGQSARMREVFTIIEKVAATPSTVFSGRRTKRSSRSFTVG